MFDDEVYDSVEDILVGADKTVGWGRMYEIRESHSDVAFLDTFLSERFARANHYFTYEYFQSPRQFRVSSSEYRDMRKKLLLRFTNFGKPTIAMYDGDFDNRGKLLLGHRYNSVVLNMKQAKGVLEHVCHLWGQPVNLMTITKESDEHEVEVTRRRGRGSIPEERAIRIRCGSESSEEHSLDPKLETRIAAGEIDYDTKPDDWF